MKSIYAKTLCIIVVLTIIFSAAAEAADFTSAIKSLNIDDGGNISMIVNKTSEESGKGIVAVYNTKGQLEKAVMSEEVNGSGEKTLTFNETLIKDENSIVKAFLWKTANGAITLEPLSKAFTPDGQATPEPTTDPDSTPIPSDGIIHLLGDSINADGVENVTIDGTTATITAAGEYTIEGTLDDGQIVVALSGKKDEAVINLNGVNIASSAGAPFAANEGKVEVSAKKGTVNTLKSTAVYIETEEKTPNACLYSRRDLKIKGSGTLTVESSFNNGIGTRGDLTIQKATVNVTSTDKHGIKGNDSVTVTSGTITVEAAGDALKSDEIVDIQGGTLNLTGGDEGIQAGESETDAATGETVITNGVITISEETAEATAVTITSEGDGINATEGNITVTGGTVTVNSQNDCIQADNITNISGGTLDLTAHGGAPQNVSSSNTATDSCKGVKAGKLVYISGGEFNINTYDDAVHSNHTVRISGGNITAATGDDGVHGDSYLYISDNADINITKSYEGIEAAEIYISGGETRIVSTDDGANAAGDEPTDEAYDIDNASEITTANSSVELYAGPGGNQGGWGGPNWGGEDNANYGYLEINGGYLYVTTSSGDGLDANGNIVINGGISIVDGATLGSEDGLDFDKGVTFNGGYVFTMTAGGMDSVTGAYPQKYLLYGFSGGSSIAAGSYCIVDSSNNVLCAFNRSKGSFKRVTFSSPDVTAGTYYIKPLAVSGLAAINSIYGTIDPQTYSFTLADGCSVNASGTSYTMSAY